MKHFILTSCIALAAVGVLAASQRSVEARPKPAGADLSLVVTSVSPARNQHVLSDFSDPGVRGQITVRFSTWVNPRDLVDEQDVVNGLSRKCDFHDQTLAMVPASARVSRNFLFVSPLGQSLAPGRYTLTLKPSIRSARGRLLNEGARAWSTTFFVGSQTNFTPVLRRISPQAGRKGVGLRRSLVVTFDERIDGASASASVRLEDRSTVPPTPIPARVLLARQGFDVLVSPDTPGGYPPDSDVALVIAGQGSATVPSPNLLVEGAGRHVFRRDNGPQWTADPAVPTLFHSRNGDFDDVTGEFTMTFHTRAARR